MTGSDIGSIIGLGVDLIFFTIFYRWFKTINRSADEIKKAPYRKLDDSLVKELSEGKSSCLAYACVEGEVMPVREVLHSRHAEGKTGVMQHIIITEHKSKRLQGIWTDVKNTIQDKIQTVPFTIKRWLGKEAKTEILVTEPTTANFLLDDLTITHDVFEPVEGGNMLSRGMDHLFGDVSKGYHETEKMLLTNTLLLGIGEIAYLDNKLQLQPPKNGQMYILTKLSRGEVIKKLENKSFWVKFFMLSAGAIGTALLIHIIYKQIKIFKAKRIREDFINSVRELRRQTEDQREESDNDISSSCVVCLSNPREIVLLDCGHICLCAECVTILPEPLKCPVCRQDVDRYLTTYNP
ncbi:mitochondrial ubiquitin ligase activator of nfkb 1-like [Ruditapes philippinarum]|uniref:mitochondrial ubiquitin ligase activator of nfkb 1-like n=1 Tax=Ruditapes philippinarum TaxID=129788 RepID=UPI00295AAAD7|nr:mitochondrial ubiquitin ligase activator of nfkb 1-like [Ruditapes philippinarum]